MDRDRVEAVKRWKLLALTGLIPYVIKTRALGLDFQTAYHGKVCDQGNTFRQKHIPGSVFPVAERR